MINRSDIEGQLASLVQGAIEDSGRSKKSVSDETGIPYPTLNRKLAGKAEFSFRELYLLAAALGVPAYRFTPTAFVRPRSEKAVA